MKGRKVKGVPPNHPTCTMKEELFSEIAMFEMKLSSVNLPYFLLKFLSWYVAGE